MPLNFTGRTVESPDLTGISIQAEDAATGEPVFVSFRTRQSKIMDCLGCNRSPAISMIRAKPNLTVASASILMNVHNSRILEPSTRIGIFNDFRFSKVWHEAKAAPSCGGLFVRRA